MKDEDLDNEEFKERVLRPVYWIGFTMGALAIGIGVGVAHILHWLL